MDYFTIFTSVLILFIPIVIGYLLAKFKLVDESFAKNISVLIFNITLPCSIVTSMQYDFKPEMLIDSSQLIAISFIVIAFGFITGRIVASLTGATDYFGRVMAFSTTFSNFSFMGYPIAQALFGQQGFLYAAIYSIPLFIMVQSFGVIYLDVRAEQKNSGFAALKRTLNPPLIAVILGFTAFASGIRLPVSVNQALEFLAIPTTPLAMILAGLVLVNAPLRTLFSSFRYYIVLLLRLILIPLVLYIILSLIGLNGVMLGVPVVITMMPVAANLVITVAKFDGDVTAAAHLVMLSTLLSMITIPVLAVILNLHL